MQQIENMVQPARPVHHFHGHDIGDADRKSIIFQSVQCLGAVIDNQTQDAKIRGVSQRKRANIDICL